MPTARAIGASWIALAIVLGPGCARVPTGLGSGEPCVRSEQCQPTLICNMGACTADLTGLGGMPPVRPMDAGPVDAQVDPDAEIGMDAGPSIDSGMDDAGELDAFVPVVDAGEVDAFVPEVDAFVPEVDAFVPEVDAFVPEVDAFVPDPDAGL